MIKAAKVMKGNPSGLSPKEMMINAISKMRSIKIGNSLRKA